MLNVTNFLISKIIAEREGLTSNDATRLAMTGAVLPGAAKQVLMTQQMAKTAVAAQPETIRAEIKEQGLPTKDDLVEEVNFAVERLMTPEWFDENFKQQVMEALNDQDFAKKAEIPTGIAGLAVNVPIGEQKQEFVLKWAEMFAEVLLEAAKNQSLKEILGQALNANLSSTPTSPAPKK